MCPYRFSKWYISLFKSWLIVYRELTVLVGFLPKASIWSYVCIYFVKMSALELFIYTKLQQFQQFLSLRPSAQISTRRCKRTKKIDDKVNMFQFLVDFWWKFTYKQTQRSSMGLNRYMWHWYSAISCTLQPSIQHSSCASSEDTPILLRSLRWRGWRKSVATLRSTKFAKRKKMEC